MARASGARDREFESPLPDQSTEQGAEMPTAPIPMDCILERLTAEDDRAAWKAVLSMVSEEFVERYRAEKRKKESWFLRIGACSHWVRPHQSRWIAAGGFAL